MSLSLEQNPQIDEKAIRQLVEAFYAKAIKDPDLEPIFQPRLKDTWEEHMTTITAFWCSIMLGKGDYSGNPMRAHAAVPEITPAHFDRWLKLWAETTNSLFPEEVAAIFQFKAQRMGDALSRGLKKQS